MQLKLKKKILKDLNDLKKFVIERKLKKITSAYFTRSENGKVNFNECCVVGAMMLKFTSKKAIRTCISYSLLIANIVKRLKLRNESSLYCLNDRNPTLDLIQTIDEILTHPENHFKVEAFDGS